MNTPARLGLYGAGLAVLFVGAFAAADAVVPQSTVDRWTQEAEGGHGMDHEAGATVAAVRGTSSAQDGYLLTPVAAPGEVDESGTLSFQVQDAHGEALTSYATEHDKELHLIVVRTDGSRFRHVHPTLAADGTWSLPWEWSAAGTYRVYTDFVPEGGDPVTLTRTVDVAGAFTPATPALATTATVDGFTVDLVGDLVVGESAQLTLSVSKDGEPVTTLQPYLGAFGHLVALREGDLAYLHVHPEGDEPTAGETSGPEISFMAEAPTPGRYLLYLDFQVDGQVHSAPFVVEAS